MSAEIDDDLFSPSAIADPQSYYGRIRDLDPVHWNPRHRSWILTRYEDVAAAFTERRLSNNVLGGLSAHGGSERSYQVLSRWMPFSDPPTHTRLRRLAHAAFTPRRVERMRSHVERIVETLLDDMARGGRDVDLLQSLCFPLPATVIAELLGVPPADRSRFKTWSDGLGGLIFSALGDPHRHSRAEEAVVALEAYFRDIIERYRREPGDDLISGFIEVESEGEQLTTEEMVSMCILLLFAGHETTTNLLGSALIALMRSPEKSEQLRSDPGIIETAVEEFVRFEGPAKMTVRRAAEALEIGGRPIGAGQRVLLVQVAANRDPERFAAPNALDLTRDPNPHLGFGRGIHYCLGSPLARLEVQIALPLFLERFPRARLVDDVRYHPNLLVRAPTAVTADLG